MRKFAAALHWLPHWFAREFKYRVVKSQVCPRHIYVCICDHFEPYWSAADSRTAKRRLKSWIDKWPILAERYRDTSGEMLKYSFFYPEEEYRKNDMDVLADLCHAGYGEVEIHLHHDNDTSHNLRRTLLDYKKRLHEVHGLLPVNKRNGEIAYGFIHGNWTLDNSGPDGRWCGVNNEITILEETGCYADFTMPSAPSPTQTRQVNSIYFAVDDPDRCKSHDRGTLARVGSNPQGLLMIQGPLGVAWKRRKKGLIPRIENSGLMASNPVGRARVEDWVSAGVHVEGAPDEVFVKLYAHGCQEENLDWFFNGGGESLFIEVSNLAASLGAELHFVSARELVNKVWELISGAKEQLLMCSES